MKTRTLAVILLLGSSIVLHASNAPKRAARPVVNINTATMQQLQLLPGVGPVIAGRIIEESERLKATTGKGFSKPEQLLDVPGIGKRTFERMRPYVTVTGETTATRKIRISERSK